MKTVHWVFIMQMLLIVIHHAEGGGWSEWVRRVDRVGYCSPACQRRVLHTRRCTVDLCPGNTTEWRREACTGDKCVKSALVKEVEQNKTGEILFLCFILSTIGVVVFLFIRQTRKGPTADEDLHRSSQYLVRRRLARYHRAKEGDPENVIAVTQHDRQASSQHVHPPSQKSPGRTHDRIVPKHSDVQMYKYPKENLKEFNEKMFKQSQELLSHHSEGHTLKKENLSILKEHMSKRELVSQHSKEHMPRKSKENIALPSNVDLPQPIPRSPGEIQYCKQHLQHDDNKRRAEHSKQNIPQQHREQVPQQSNQNIQYPNENMPQHSKQHMPQHPNENMPQHSKQHMPQHSNQNIPQHLNENMPQHSKQHMPQHSKQNIRQHSKQSISQQSKQTLTHSGKNKAEEPKQSMLQYLKEKMSSHSKQDVLKYPKQTRSQHSKQTIQRPIQNIHHSKQSIPQQSKQNIQHSKQHMPEHSKQHMPEHSKQHMSEDANDNMPQHSKGHAPQPSEEQVSLHSKGRESLQSKGRESLHSKGRESLHSKGHTSEQFNLPTLKYYFLQDT